MDVCIFFNVPFENASFIQIRSWYWLIENNKYWFKIIDYWSVIYWRLMFPLMDTYIHYILSRVTSVGRPRVVLKLISPSECPVVTMGIGCLASLLLLRTTLPVVFCSPVVFWPTSRIQGVMIDWLIDWLIDISLYVLLETVCIIRKATSPYTTERTIAQRIYPYTCSSPRRHKAFFLKSENTFKVWEYSLIIFCRGFREFS